MLIGVREGHCLLHLLHTLFHQITIGILLLIRFYYPTWPLTFLSLMHPLGEDNSACLLPATWVASSSGEECFSLLAGTGLKAMGTQSQPDSQGIMLLKQQQKGKRKPSCLQNSFQNPKHQK